MTRPSDPIVVVGAGPTGLALALSLGLHDIPCVVLEREPALPYDLRAGSYHPPTIEMLDALGVAQTMIANGVKVPVWQMRDRVEGVIAEFELALLAEDTPFPFRLHYEQFRLTPLLLARIEEAAPSVSVRFGQEVETVTQDADGARVLLAGGETIRASFVVGCDGGRSTVRQASGIVFEGFTYPERFLVASTSYDLTPLGFSAANYIADPELWATSFKMPGDRPPGIWRIAYPTDPELPAEEATRPEAVRARLDTILEHVPGALSAAEIPLVHVNNYTVHQRVAQRFVAGRIVLAGDSAHVNNPIGGLGLNGGIHDAVNLAEKFGQIWHEGAEPGERLDLYDRQRRPVSTRAIQAMSIRNKALLEERDPDVRRQRADELRALAADPVRARAHLLNTSMLNSVRDAAAVD